MADREAGGEAGQERADPETATAAARIVRFVEQIEGMKVQTRTAWASNGRHESVAEHSWRLAMLALAAAPHLPDVDAGHLVELCLVHDLGEVFEGDVAAPVQDDGESKEASEREAIARLTGEIGGATAGRIRSLWEEYNAARTPAARAAKALDKIETIVQHNQGDNPADFDYGYNLAYGASLAHDAPLLVELRRIADEATGRRAGR